MPKPGDASGSFDGQIERAVLVRQPPDQGVALRPAPPSRPLGNLRRCLASGLDCVVPIQCVWGWRWRTAASTEPSQRVLSWSSGFDC